MVHPPSRRISLLWVGSVRNDNHHEPTGSITFVAGHGPAMTGANRTEKPETQSMNSLLDHPFDHSWRDSPLRLSHWWRGPSQDQWIRMGSSGSCCASSTSLPRWFGSDLSSSSTSSSSQCLSRRMMRRAARSRGGLSRASRRAWIKGRISRQAQRRLL